MNAMKAQGLQVVPVTDGAEGYQAVVSAESMMSGKLVPADLHDQAKRILAAFRATTMP